MTGTPESGVFFFKTNGHSHDGQNSSFIDTNNYSIFDFSISLIATNKDPKINLRRTNNELIFKRYIMNIVYKDIGADLIARIKKLENALGI